MDTKSNDIKIEKFEGNRFEECTYVIYDIVSREAVIVDCGLFYENVRKRFLCFLSQNELRPVHLLMTHGHHDHIYGNDLVLEHYGLLPEMHKDDLPLMGAHLHNRLFEEYKDNYPYTIPMPGHYLADGDIIGFGSHLLRVIHTPGHSPGSVFFYCEEAGIAFSGDTLFKRGYGNTALAFGNRDELFASLDYIMQLLPDETVIYPGHGGKSTIGAEKEYLRDHANDYY